MELYRRGEEARIILDLDNEYDRAIYCAVEIYTDYLERMSLTRECENSERRNIYEVEELSPYAPEVKGTPRWVESSLKLLRSVAAEPPQVRVDQPEDLFDAANDVAESLFAPGGKGPYRIPRDFWESGEKPLDGEATAPADQTSNLAPVAHLLRFGFG